MAIIDDLRRHYRQGGMLLRIVYINIAIFLLLHLVGLVMWMTGTQEQNFLLTWLAMPSSFKELMWKPWTVFTYCFTHENLWHILFNLLWLYGIGRIFMEFFSPKQLSALYLLGGIAGALIYLVAYNVLPPLLGTQGLLIGASASVMAIVVAVGLYAPNYKIGILFLGQISLKWIALVMVVLSVMSIQGDNPGGNIAHLGGALIGLWFATAIRKGHDITRWLNKLLDGMASFKIRMPARRKSKPQVGQPVGGTAYRGNTTSNDDTPTEEELDRVLAKLKRSGYSALTDKERDILFKASRKR